ncbi:MAG: septum site-determining protein MinD [Clostridia bacterium]|nr:septum site-determining protein MinD [Clostridia bacterium]
MAEKYVITSGKGGVGKTTICANLAKELALKGYRVLVIDGDVGLNNLDVLTGVENISAFDLFDVVKGKCRARQALCSSPLSNNLYVLPSTKTSSSVEITSQEVKSVIAEIEGLFDYIFIDCPAGIDASFHRAVSISTRAIVVVTPSITSVRDADKVIAILKSYPLNSILVVLNRLRGDLVLSGESLSSEEVESTLKTEVIGVIPEDDVLSFNRSVGRTGESSKAFKNLALYLEGKPFKVYDYTKKYTGFFGSIRKELKKRL